MYGHVAKLAEEIQKGAASVEGVEAKLWQVRKFHYIHHFLRLIKLDFKRKRKGPIRLGMGYFLHLFTSART